MELFFRHRFFLRCVSLVTALTILPTSVQAWHFLPAPAFDGGGGVDRDLAGLLDMMASLEAAANPPRPASPWLVADAAPPEGPAPLGEPQRQWLATHPSVPANPAPESPVVHLAQASAGEAIPPVTPGESGERLAQRGGVTSTLNLAVTPSPALPGEVPPAPESAESAESRALPVRPVSRAGASLPDVAAFFARLDNPDAAPPRPLPPVVVAQAGPGVEAPAPRVSSHHYLSHPESSPAAPALIAANGLLLEGNHSGALRATLAVMDAYTHTAPVIDAQTQFDDILNDLIEREEAGDSAPFAAAEAGLPGENGALLAAFASVESRYALIAFFQSRMLRALETDNAGSAAAYAARTMDLADRTLRENPAHPLQNDVLHYYYDTAVFMGGETYGRCPDYLTGLIRDNGPGIIRWTARLLLADYYARQVDEPVERTLQYASMIEELEPSGVPEALADPAAYSWLRAAIEGSIGQAYYALGDFERAAVHFNNTFGYRSGSEPKAMAMYFLADVEARKHPHDPGPAIDRYAAMIERYPEDHHADAALLAMAALYHAYGDYAGAIQLYEGVLSRYPDTRSAPSAADAIAYIYANQWGIVEVATAPGEPETPDGALAMHCGPLALQGLLALNGIACGVEELAGLAGTDATGTAMMGLVRASEAKGLPLAGVRAAEPGALKAPCIALLDGNHFVLVSAVEGASIRVRDGAQPESNMPLADFQARWGGEVLVPAGAEPLAQRLAPEAMERLKGGNGPSSVPTDEPEEECKPKSECDTCNVPPSNPQPPGPPCPGGTPGDNGFIDKSVAGGGVIMRRDRCGKGPQRGTPGRVGSPDAAGGFDGPGVNAEIDTFETSLELDELDLSLDTLDAWGLSFGRSYRSDGGFPRRETDDTAFWWENNIGAGWSHNLNVHLRTTGGLTPVAVIYWDPSGTPRTYTYDSTSGGYNWYYRSATGNPGELGNVLKRDTTTKKFTLEFPGGARAEFSAASATDENIARVESLVDASGNALTFTYNNANVALGRLTKVQSPAGDAQHLAFTYSGNLITKVELKKNTAVLNSVSFTYNGSNELITVTDHAAKTVEYEYGSDGSAAGSRFITKITNKRGIETDLAWTFGLNGLSQYEAYKIEVDNADGLTTVYDRNLTTDSCTVSNWDATTLLDKLVNTPVTGDPSLSRYIDYYVDTTTYERWTYTYDASRNLTEVTAPGNVAYAEYTYNAVGNVLTQQFGTGPVVEYEYDGSGQRLTKVIDAAGIETDYTYNVDGLLEQMEHPSLAVDGYQYEYDAYGQLTLATSPLGTEMEYTFDGLGRLTEVVQDPGGLEITTSYVYDDLGNMVEMTDPRGKVTEYEYGDPSCGACGGGGNLELVRDALTHETEWIYNADGLLETTIDAAGIETDYTYDTMGRLIEIEHPAGSAITSTITYNKLGQVASRTDFGGNTVSYEYDHMGRAITVTDAVGDVEYAYNSLGELVSVTDSLGQVTTNTYDTAFRLTKVTDDIGKETHYAYDAYGRQSAVGAGTSGTVDVTTYAYDATTGLLDSVEYGSSSYTANYTYDGEARLVQLTDWIDGVDGLRYDYDDLGRLVEITDYDDSTLTYTYDDAGNVLTMTDYHGNTTTYTYNDIGQLATLTAPGSKVWSYTYDTGNRLSRVDIPNGMHTEYTYDTSGRQDAILHKDGTTVVQGFEYTFEDGGNITRIDHEDGSYWEYDYDGRERLIEAVRGNKATPTIEATYEYTYDDADNMLTRVTPWFDDFQDENITGWSGDTGYFSVTSGVMANTSNANWRGIYLSESDADHDLRFDYVRYSGTGTGQQILRYTDANNLLYLEITPTTLFLRQRDGGTLTTLDTYSTTVSEDAWYSARAVLDGANVTVWWGAQGGSFDEVLSTTSATEFTTTAASYFRASPSSEHGLDNITIIADGRSTTQTFTHNDANEQITSTVNGVVTYMTYDEWGRLTERDDGTHTATYAYRYAGKLQSVASDFPGEGNVTYETGGDKKRRSRVDGTDETWYNWASGWLLLSEEDDSDGISGSLKRTYVGKDAHVDGGPPHTGSWKYCLRDALGSNTAIQDQDKSSIATEDYEPHGGEFTHSGDPNLMASRFAGHEWDDTSYVYFAPYRYYAPTSVRWIGRDPLGYTDGLNRYVRTRNNPVNRVDADGLFSISGDCAGKDAAITAAVTQACSNLAPWFTADIPEKKKCVEKRCKEGKIKCNRGCDGPCKNASGFNPGAGPFRSPKAHICVDQPQGAGGFGDTALHEWLHSCGYHKQDEGDLPPWGDGQ